MIASSNGVVDQETRRNALGIARGVRNVTKAVMVERPNDCAVTQN